MEGLRKATQNLGQDSRSRGRDLNPGPPEYEARVLPIRPRHSVRAVVYPKDQWAPFQFTGTIDSIQLKIMILNLILIYYPKINQCRSGDRAV
jgi:hypothetical protein